MVLADYRKDYAAALKDAATVVSLIERFMCTHPVELGDLYSMRYFYVNVGYIQYSARHCEDAIRYSQRALAISLPGPDANALRGEALNLLGGARWQSGDLDGALKTALESIELVKAEAGDGHAAILINLAEGFEFEGMILGKRDGEPSFGRTREALANFQKALEIAEDLCKKDPLDYLGRHHVAISGLELGNIIRHDDPYKALAVYDHALARIREAKTNASTQSAEADLLAGSSYPVRWLGREKEARQRIARALELLSHAGRYPADKVEPMSDAYDVLRAQADDYAQTGRTSNAVESYQQLLDKLIAWHSDPQNDLRDAVCLSRTWVALADLYRLGGQKDHALQLDSKRVELWNHWQGRLPGAHFLLSQSLSQITPPPGFFPTAKHSSPS
jgi:tetratricopeptide (TPR) repeat protein